ELLPSIPLLVRFLISSMILSFSGCPCREISPSSSSASTFVNVLSKSIIKYLLLLLSILAVRKFETLISSIFAEKRIYGRIFCLFLESENSLVVFLLQDKEKRGFCQ